MNNLVLEHHKFDKQELTCVTTTYLNEYPIVYILYNKKEKPTAYIGQTVQVDRRMRDHLKNKKRAILTDTLLIGDEMFNQSATYNIETNLINHFIADEQFKLQNVSQTRELQMHNYHDKTYYDKELFGELWEALRQCELAKDSLDVLENKDIYKVSPYKELSSEQLEIKKQILDYVRKNISKDEKKIFVIEGEAGTGKSVVLASLFNTLEDLAKEMGTKEHQYSNYLLVNHGEMIKTYHSIAKSLPNMKKKDILRPTTFVNSMEKNDDIADVVIVDEAHLLLTQRDKYNNFDHESHLEEIVKHSKITIVVYDPKQMLKIKNYWNPKILQHIENKYEIKADYFQLTEQFRMQSSQEVVDWINDFVEKKIDKLPKNIGDFQFRMIKTPAELDETIQNLNKEKKLSRIVATFDYVHKKDGEKYYVDKDGLNRVWNITTAEQKTWAEREETINEVGSIYTVQGFDLNYVGVLLGPSVDYDEEANELTIDIDKYQDVGAFTGRSDLSEEEIIELKEQIILNSINVLLKRGVHGLFIYATNEKLRNKLLALQKERDEAYE